MSRSISPQEHRARQRIANALRRARARSKLPLRVVAHDAGVSRHTWTRYEKSTASIPAEVLSRVARAARTSVVSLLAGAR